jgi:hypothetical protein
LCASFFPVMAPRVGKQKWHTRDAARRGRAVKEIGLSDLLRSFVPVVGQDAMELLAEVDGELGEDLVQVVFDGARAHE